MILHLVRPDEWSRHPERPYAPASLAEEGFVHCSPDEATALAVADSLYRDTPSPLLVLLIDEAALDAPVRWEDPAPSPPPGCPPGVRFPHVYGPVNRTAVTGLMQVRRDAEGRSVALVPWG
ncbi:hypothetical protein AQ490_20285 [Wenjunlia vitaminophila]|uniref:DUF952 domain-containing protein n=1 Tax=Wenjunlia vitaminophila TaxID=76728 RepID=A0A0T6LUC8_WENVI|nr:DUF952 domain-containing protein [Wenjunlia vitaminophila]KRV49691.1 hypothetical protein AQ490_20285 [Wenjunlia vitaminophila]